MIKFSINDLYETSYADLEGALKVIQNELNRRHMEERKKAIEDFKKAFSALQEAGVRVYGVDDYSGQLTFDSWDDFFFD